MGREFLSLSECAEELRLCERTVIRLIQTDQLKACRFGKQWRVAKGDLVAYIEASLVKGKAA